MAGAPSVVVNTSRSTAASGLVLIAIAIYLGMVVYHGNLSAFVTQFWQDFSGGAKVTGSNTGVGVGVTVTASKGIAFWQWFIALIVLYLLSKNPTTQPYFGPFLAIMIVAMLIQLQTNSPGAISNLTTALKGVFPGKGN